MRLLKSPGFFTGRRIGRNCRKARVVSRPGNGSAWGVAAVRRTCPSADRSPDLFSASSQLVVSASFVPDEGGRRVGWLLRPKMTGEGRRLALLQPILWQPDVALLFQSLRAAEPSSREIRTFPEVARFPGWDHPAMTPFWNFVATQSICSLRIHSRPS